MKHAGDAIESFRDSVLERISLHYIGAIFSVASILEITNFVAFRHLTLYPGLSPAVHAFFAIVCSISGIVAWPSFVAKVRDIVDECLKLIGNIIEPFREMREALREFFERFR